MTKLWSGAHTKCVPLRTDEYAKIIISSVTKENVGKVFCEAFGVPWAATPDQLIYQPLFKRLVPPLFSVESNIEGFTVNT